MNLKKCQYFVALAEEMNFTKASEALHITQQSLSGSIKRLEEEYGVELFQRKPYLKLTPAGETMLFYSKQMLRNESQMMASLADLSAECSGHLVLGMSRQRIQVFFPGIWERYHNAYPNVSLDLRQSYTLKMADSLQAGKLDLFIGVDVPTASNLNMIPLASEYLFCLIHDNILKECCPNHWQELLNKSAIEGLDVSDLKDFPILLLASDNRIRSLLERAYDRCGIMPKTILEASDQNIIYQLACSAQGAAFLSPMILFDHKKGAITWPENCHCLRMNHSFSKIDISLVYRNDLILPHYAEGMKKAITQEFYSYAMAMKSIS